MMPLQQAQYHQPLKYEPVGYSFGVYVASPAELEAHPALDALEERKKRRQLRIMHNVKLSVAKTREQRFVNDSTRNHSRCSQAGDEKLTQEGVMHCQI